MIIGDNFYNTASNHVAHGKYFLESLSSQQEDDLVKATIDDLGADAYEHLDNEQLINLVLKALVSTEDTANLVTFINQHRQQLKKNLVDSLRSYMSEQFDDVVSATTV